MPVGAVVVVLAHKFSLHRPLLLGGDAVIYARFAGEMMDGRLPYRDFGFEYPPLSLAAFVAPRLIGLGAPMTQSAYDLRFGLLMLGLAGLLAFLTVRTIVRMDLASSATPRLLVFAAACVLLAPVLLWRFDLVPAVCSSAALLGFLGRRDRSAGLWLGLGFAAKLYPAVLGPVLFAERLARRDLRALGGLVLGGAIAVALTVLPFALLAREGLGHAWAYHTDRGVQIESLAGGFVLLAARLGWTDVSLRQAYGSDEIVSAWTAAVAPLLPAVTAGGILLLSAVAFLRFRRDHGRGADTGPALVAYGTLALLAFILTSKVLSPQYLVWLLPCLPLLPGRHAAPLLLACALTGALFPWQYWGLTSLQLPAILLLNARNLTLVAAAAGLLVEYLPTTRPEPRTNPA